MTDETKIARSELEQVQDPVDDAADDGISSASSSEFVEGDQQHPTAVGDASKSSPESEWEKILGTDELLRKVIKSGTSDAKAVVGDVVTLRVEGKLENGQTVDCCDNLTFLLGHSESIPAFDVCVPFMKVGEIDAVKTSPRFAYGKAGKENEIPPDATILYEIELVSVEIGPDFDELAAGERLTWADRKKERGNYFFKRKEYTSAIDVYNRALNILKLDSTENEDDRHRLVDARATLYNNLAAAQLKIRAWSAALSSLRQCISTQPKNVKALFRLGQAYMGQEQYEAAISSFMDVLALDPDNKAAKRDRDYAVRQLKFENERSKEFYKRMFEKGLPSSGTRDSSFLDKLTRNGYVASGAIVTAAVVAAGAIIFRYFNKYEN